MNKHYQLCGDTSYFPTHKHTQKQTQVPWWNFTPITLVHIVFYRCWYNHRIQWCPFLDDHWSVLVPVCVILTTCFDLDLWGHAPRPRSTVLTLFLRVLMTLWLRRSLINKEHAPKCYLPLSFRTASPALGKPYDWPTALQWHHDERDGVSNYRRLDCLFGRWFRRRSKKTAKHHWPLWGESTGGQWIPITKDQ